ncbi:MAG: sigma-70 family RNA polymerase sigma factor [Chloroflexi bacterium]|nr:sigma-70 family RNA polymerase sigma factor [Chloroflexota bacterium]
MIAECLAGDEQAWKNLVEKYNRLIYSIPFRYGLPDSEAADIFQSVCLKLLENLPKLRDSSKLSSWLITTTSRECWGVIRRLATISRGHDYADDEERHGEQLDPSPLPEETILELEEQQTMAHAFRLLPERCQHLLWYLYYDKTGLSYAEIGRRLGIPEGSVGPSRARCLGKLRALLEEADLA